MNNYTEHSFTIVNIKKEYLEYLYTFDNKVPKEHIDSRKRPYIGIVFTIDDILYFAPLSSPKPKYKRLNNKIDFYKLKNGKLGAINFNNMIPVTENVIMPIDINNEPNKQYKRLLQSQIAVLNRIQNDIRKKAYRLYDKYVNNKLDTTTRSRCCDFKLLESKLFDYLSNNC